MTRSPHCQLFNGTAGSALYPALCTIVSWCRRQSATNRYLPSPRVAWKRPANVERHVRDQMSQKPKTTEPGSDSACRADPPSTRHARSAGKGYLPRRQLRSTSRYSTSCRRCSSLQRCAQIFYQAVRSRFAGVGECEFGKVWNNLRLEESACQLLLMDNSLNSVALTVSANKLPFL